MFPFFRSASFRADHQSAAYDALKPFFGLSGDVFRRRELTLCPWGRNDTRARAGSSIAVASMTRLSEGHY
jgi:hypothetical protein